jgi:hypothetical protein
MPAGGFAGVIYLMSRAAAQVGVLDIHSSLRSGLLSGAKFAREIHAVFLRE